MSKNDNERLVWTVDEAADQLGIGRTAFYALIGRGELRTITIGRSRRVPKAELERFLHECLEEPVQ